jgi:oligopeptide transport system substrate-binding protein
MTILTLRSLKALCLGGAASVVLVSCSGGTTTPRLAVDQTLNLPILSDFSTLDPGQLNAEADSQIAQNLFDGLVRYDKDLNIVPDIASAMPAVSTDGLTYTFSLRHDVTFWNGDRVTSKDVLYSWNRAAAMQSPNAGNLSAIAGYSTVQNNLVAGAALESLLEKSDPAVTMAGLTAPDAYTVKVRLTAASGWFLSAIALQGTVAMVVDQNVVKTDFENWWTKPETLIGTGPFRMTARTANQSVDFQAVPNWWGVPKPTLTKVHLDLVQGASAAIAAYEQGTYDIYGYGGYSTAPVDDIRRVQATANEKAQVLLHPKLQTTWVSFNMVSDVKRPAQGPFTIDQGQTSHDLRLAFALAIDKTKLATDLCHNISCWPATGGLITKGLMGYLGDGNDPLGRFDAVRAKALLTKADPDGSKTKGLSYSYDSSSQFSKDVAIFLQDQWLTNLGVKVEVKPIDLNQYIPSRLKGAYVLSRDDWQADYNHPQDWYDNRWGKLLGCPDSNCTSGYDTVAYDTLLAKADAEPPGFGLSDYVALNQQLIDDVVYIPLYYSVGAFLIKPYVSGAGSNNIFDFGWNEIQILYH